MAIKKADPKVDFIAIEHEMLDFWKSRDIFNKLVKKNAGKPRWSFLDGPITANNPMGVHHAWGRTLKDMYQRLYAMQGHELRYQNGFDCQGLWVEVEVEKELGFATKRDVEEFGIEKFVNLCKERVRKYSKIQTEQSKRLGYWMDWDNSYYTMSDENNYTIWAFLKKLFNEEKIYRGTDVVPWSGRSGTSYSQMEIIEGRKLVAHDSIFVRFPLKDRNNEYLLVWTTTPWTLTSNVATAVNKDLDYVKLRASDGSLYYFAKENLEFKRLDKQFKEKKNWVEGVPKLKTIAQIFKERGGYTEEGTLKGSELIGLAYEGPFDHLEAQNIAGGYPFKKKDLEKKGVTSVECHKVIDGGKDREGNAVVIAGEGTGIVHIAPGCGDIDHKIGQKLGLVDIAPLDTSSKFIDGFDWLKGLSATDPATKDKIIEDLKKRGFLVHVEKYPHIYPHCWRSGDELVFRIVDEWYINMDWRNRIKKVVNDINWIPEWGQEREHEWLDNMGDWMISKKRFWGLALPIWVFEDKSFYVVGSKDELKELSVEGWEEFDGNSPHRPWIDKVKIRHPETGLIGTRIKDVGNPWLDAGIVPFSTMKYISDRAYWKKWFPADFVTENFQGQFRNWFYSMLAMSALLEEKAPFKTLLGHALVKDETGRDMHKSWGNAIWFDVAAEKMGVDVMRWMYASQNVEHNLLFGYGHADDIRKKLLTLWNSYSFFATYAAVDGFDPQKLSFNKEDFTILDRWILSKLNLLIIEGDKELKKFRADLFMRKVERFIEEMSNWYIRRNRRRFWKSDNDTDKYVAYYTLYTVLLTLVKILAPVMPFVTDHIYQNLARNTDPEAPESIHLCDYPGVDASFIDELLVTQVDALKKLVELGRSARNQAKIKIRQPLSKLSFTINDDKIAKFILDNKSVVLDELNIKTLERVKNSKELITFNVKPNLPVLGAKYGKALKSIRELLLDTEAATIENELRSNGSFRLNVDSEEFSLGWDDLILEPVSAENYASNSDNDITVGLWIPLTAELEQEGLVRDFIRHIQIMRKEADFAVEDRIKIHAELPEQVETAVQKFEKYFLSETLTIERNNKLKFSQYNSTFNVREITVEVGISKV